MSAIVQILVLLAAGLGVSFAPPAASGAQWMAWDPIAWRADGANGQAMWQSSSVVGPDGALRWLPGWRVRLGHQGRAHLLGPAPRVPTASGLWDDAAETQGVRVAVRATARDPGAVYVEGRLRRGTQTRSFLLRWDAASGDWTEALP